MSLPAKYKTITGGSKPESKFKNAGGTCGSSTQECAPATVSCSQSTQPAPKPTPIINVTHLTQNITQNITNSFILKNTSIVPFKYVVPAVSNTLSFPQYKDYDLILGAVDGMVLYDVNLSPDYNQLAWDKDNGILSLGGSPFNQHTFIKLILQGSDAVSGNLNDITNTIEASLTTDGFILLPADRMIDSILIRPATSTPALNVGTTGGGAEYAGPETIDANGGLIISQPKYTGNSGLTLYFTGITGVTSVKIYLKNENLSAIPV